MKNIFKKIIICCLCIILAMPIVAYANPDDEIFMEMRIAKQSEERKTYDLLYENFLSNDEMRELVDLYYAGAYFGENDQVVILVKNTCSNQVQQYMKTAANNALMDIRKVTYSYKELESVFMLLNSLVENEYSNPEADDIFQKIVSLYISDKDNRVIVELTDIASDTIAEFEQKVLKNDMIMYRSGEIPTADTTYSQGSGISIDDSLYSMGFRCVRGSTKGFVTAGHGSDMAVGASVNSGNTVIGTVNRFRCDSTLDAAFVTVNSSHSISNYVGTSGYYTGAVAYVPLQDELIRKQGATTGLTVGSVLGTNVSGAFPDAGGWCTGLVSASINGDGGDSGGIAFCGTEYAKIVGIHKGGIAMIRYYVRTDKIMNAFGVSLY